MVRLQRELKALHKNPISNPKNIPDNVTLSDETDCDKESQIEYGCKLLEDAKKYNNSKEGRIRNICLQLNGKRNYPIKLQYHDDVLIRDSAKWGISRPKEVEVMCTLNRGLGLRVTTACDKGEFIIDCYKTRCRRDGRLT